MVVDLRIYEYLLVGINQLHLGMNVLWIQIITNQKRMVSCSKGQKWTKYCGPPTSNSMGPCSARQITRGSNPLVINIAIENGSL